MSHFSISRHHVDWMSLLEISGPFISLPVLLRVFPQGLEPRDAEAAKLLRQAYQEWQDNPNVLSIQRTWIKHVLTQLLQYPTELLREGQLLPAGLTTLVAEHNETLRPDLALLGIKGTASEGITQLLINIYPPDQALDKPIVTKNWKATPQTRMMELLHATNIPLGLITNGEQWTLVYAPRGETTGFTSWYASLWLDEKETLRAFVSLLGRRRFFGVAATDTLLAMLKESAEDQQEVTQQLGNQVRDAVYVLIQALERLDHGSQRTLLAGVAEKTLYDAALTLMMRLVFLFSAEERGLLHLGEPIYDNNYAVSTLCEQLQEVADRHGEEVLERRYDAWARLLATFRAVHAGVRHQDLMMPAYGGSLFDPDRYPFLEGRLQGTHWQKVIAQPLMVDNRVVLHLLKSLQVLQVKMAGGGVAEAQRMSFRALDIEQIGHVYEGLLEHTAIRATDVVLGLASNKKRPNATINLKDLIALANKSEKALIDTLIELTDRSSASLKKALAEAKADTLGLETHKLSVACHGDTALINTIKPFARLLREDSFERPVIVLAGGIYVGKGNDRRSSGSHYTPRSLTEPIVRHTLEPLVYQGVSEGKPKEQWQLKTPKEILNLKVCDMAMGSGAFLVQTCRYLSERLVEAWEVAEQAHPSEVLVTPEGDFSRGEVAERLLPNEAAERLAIARRLIADRCLYGVDINPMAVEMAKLSLWLITVDKKRPFSFLDHALKCGDSLLGISELKQLEHFSLQPNSVKQTAFETANLWRHIDTAKQKRLQLEAMPSDTPQQVAIKAALYAEAEDALAKLNAAADVLMAVELKGLKAKAYQQERELVASRMMAYWAQGLTPLQDYAQGLITGYKTLHWPLAYPEVVDKGGFDAFVGNPPFMGGQKITGELGKNYRDEYLVKHIASGQMGSADLCAYFFLRAAKLLKDKGMMGLIATNTIAQGDTREVALDQLYTTGFTIPRAIPSTPWQGVAALEVAHVWLYKGNWQGAVFLDDKPAKAISAYLTLPNRVEGNPYRLMANADKSFQGSIVLGMGFVLEPEEAQALIAKNSKNKDCLFPYLNGEDLNSRADQSPSRWVINFNNWPLNRSTEGKWLNASEDDCKAWLRQGRVPSDYPYPVAVDYPDLLAIVEERVKPERIVNNDAAARDYWWRFLRVRGELYATIQGMERVLAVPLVSKHAIFSFSSIDMVFSHALGAIAFDGLSEFLLLQSTIHEEWARHSGSSLETRMRYTPTDCFETFPFPENIQNLADIGEQYYQHRQAIMLNRQEGLTKTYNRFHNPKEQSDDITQLRQLHVQMDTAVAAAYGWQDLNLNHGFYETKQGLRYTIDEEARREVLNRLLELNHQRYAEEVEAGLHDKAPKKSAAKAKAQTKKTDKTAAPVLGATVQGEMFDCVQPSLFD